MNEIQKSYGLTDEMNLKEMCAEVCECLGHGSDNAADKLLYEIMGAETGRGTIKDPTAGAGMGICQFDEAPFKDQQSRYKQRHINLIERDFDINIMDVEWTDFRENPLLSLIACRMLFKPFKEPIPDSMVGRARYWKEYYNTSAGKGTVKHYLEMNGFDMDMYSKAMEVDFS